MQLSFLGKQMILRTLDNVTDFSSLRIAYTRLIGTIEDRRKDLIEQYYFFCDCIKCNDIESDRLKTSLICSHLECRGCVPGKSTQCGNFRNLLSLYFEKTFVRATFLLKSWFLEIFLWGRISSFSSVRSITIMIF